MRPPLRPTRRHVPSRRAMAQSLGRCNASVNTLAYEDRRMESADVNVPERLPEPRYCLRCGHFLVERFVAAEGRSRHQCESCGFVHYQNPRVVAAIIVSHEGRLLLQQRAIEPSLGKWTFPGGFLELGERVEDGARRETLEETGLDVVP